MLRPPEPPADVRMVVDAANHLRISEFDLFRLAWERWTGETADEERLEPIFAAYMFRHVVPPWTRHFAREVMACADAGTLDRANFGADRVRRREPLPQSKAPVWVTAAIFGMFFMLIVSMKYDPQTSAPLACETGPGMRTISQVAYTLSGQPMPDCLR